jgi:hypothetical protein
VDILQAFDTPTLFGNAFAGPTWKPWRALMAALFALPLGDEALALYRHHTGRQTPPTKPFRYETVVVGRRGGKSRVLAAVAVHLATVPDHSAHLVPGEVGVVAIIAKDRKQARVLLGYVSGTLRASELLSDMIETELAESIVLTNSVTIEIHTGSVGAPRGRTFIAVLADEIAFWETSGDAAAPDVEVINAVRPGLASIPYSLLLIASSPYAKRGVLYQNYAKYFGNDTAPVLVWQASTEEMNASLVGDSLIEEMYREDPERATAEFGGQFRTDIVAFITREAVEDCLAHGVREIPAGAGITYVGHVDPSGGSADSMTLAIAHMRDDGLAVLDAIREVKPPFSPDSVVQEFATLLKSYGISRVVGDCYAGEWPRERFAVHGIAYDVSKKNTSAIYGEFLPALNARRVQLLDLPRLIGQLVGLERRVARGGRDSIAHPPGSHDDVANSACGALVQVIGDRRPALADKNDLLVDGAPALMEKCDYVFAAMASDELGMAAVVFCARSAPYGVPLVLVDFEVMPLSANLFRTAERRCAELSETHGARHGAGCILAPALMVQLAATIGIHVEPIPEEMTNVPDLAVSAGWHISVGSVKVSRLVAEKAETHPFGGALNFRAGADIGDDPLRAAALYAVTLALNDPVGESRRAAEVA